MSAEETPLPRRISAWFDLVDDRWRSLGVSATDRARLRREAEADVLQSLAEGATVADLVAGDPGSFATELADADGALDRTRRRSDPELTTVSLLVTALAGLALGALGCWCTFYPFVFWVMDSFALSYVQEGVAAIGAHAVAAVLCTLSAMAAVRWRFRFRRAVGPTTWLTGGFLLLGGAVSVAPTMAVAAALDYSTRRDVVLLEVLLVLGFCVLGILIARWVSVREVAPT